MLSLAMRTRKVRLLAVALISGIFFGLFILRPVNDFVAWYEHEVQAPSAWSYVGSELLASLKGSKPSKTIFYAIVGALFSLLAAAFYSSVYMRNRRIDELTAELGKDLDALIKAGESETLEFKSSFRWDMREKRANRSLEGVIMKSLAGFLNGRGGTLLIGVADDGEIIGLEQEYLLLRKADRDGFEQALVTAIVHHLGGDLLPCVHVVFHRHHGKEVCRVIVEPAPRPVYLEQSDQPKLYLRSGVTTRELNVKEAIAYQSQRWPS